MTTHCKDESRAGELSCMETLLSIGEQCRVQGEILAGRAWVDCLVVSTADSSSDSSNC